MTLVGIGARKKVTYGGKYRVDEFVCPMSLNLINVCTFREVKLNPVLVPESGFTYAVTGLGDEVTHNVHHLWHTSGFRSSISCLDHRGDQCL